MKKVNVRVNLTLENGVVIPEVKATTTGGHELEVVLDHNITEIYAQLKDLFTNNITAVDTKVTTSEAKPQRVIKKYLMGWSHISRAYICYAENGVIKFVGYDQDGEFFIKTKGEDKQLVDVDDVCADLAQHTRYDLHVREIIRTIRKLHSPTKTYCVECGKEMSDKAIKYCLEKEIPMVCYNHQKMYLARAQEQVEQVTDEQQVPDFGDAADMSEVDA